MKRLLCILILLFIPSVVKAESKIYEECPNDSMVMGQIVTCSLKLVGDENIDNLELHIDYTNLSLFEFEASSDWKVINSSLNDGGFVIELEHNQNYNGNLIGTVTYGLDGGGITSATINDNVDIEVVNFEHENVNMKNFRWFYYYDNEWDSENLDNYIDMETTLEISNNINQLSIGANGDRESSLWLDAWFSMILAEADKILINDVDFDVNKWLEQLEHNYETTHTVGSYSLDFDNSTVKFYFWIPFMNLMDGDNIIKAIFYKNGKGGANKDFAITINLNRREENIGIIEDDIVEEIKIEDRKEETTASNNIIEEIITNPDTGIALSIGLSVLSILLVGFMYYRYYRKMVNN